MSKKTGEKVDFRCNKCGEPYKGDPEELKKSRRAFPCGLKCPCGGCFRLVVNGKMLKREEE